MKGNFKFEDVGKRMPYTVPDGFFRQFEADVMARVESEAKAKRTRTRLMAIAGTLMTMAATMLLCFVLTTTMRQEEKVEFADVEQAFSNLSAEDQSYLLAVYQDDVFNVEQNNE